MRKNRRDLCHAGFTKNFIYFLMGHRIKLIAFSGAF